MRGTVDTSERFAKVSALPDAVRGDAKVGESGDIDRMVDRVDGYTRGVIRARPKAATLPVLAAVLRLEETSRNGAGIDALRLLRIEGHCAGGACHKAVDAAVLPGEAAVLGHQEAAVVGSKEDVVVVRRVDRK